MKTSALVLSFLVTLCLCSTVLAGEWNLTELKIQAAKAVPNGQEIGAAADEGSAFVGMQADGLNYQFTLASDQETQIPEAQALDYKGYKAFFFEPGMPGSGALMILLDSKKSLTILCMAGFDSDKNISSSDMTAIADKMDLSAL